MSRARAYVECMPLTETQQLPILTAEKNNKKVVKVLPAKA
jgi:hypothetical protein